MRYSVHMLKGTIPVSDDRRQALWQAAVRQDPVRQPPAVVGHLKAHTTSRSALYHLEYAVSLPHPIGYLDGGRRSRAD